MRSARPSAIVAITAAVFCLAPLGAVRAQTASPNAPAVGAPRGAREPLPDSVTPLTPNKTVALWNGRDFTGWYTFLTGRGVNADPEAVFSIASDRGANVLKVSGKEFGYVATVALYADYQLTFDVKWGEARYAPRATAVRDSGVLIHVTGPDTVWPRSFECQIQENDFGDIFHIGGVSSVVNGKRENDRVVRGENAEKPHGEWNTITVFCQGDVIINIVNDKLVNVATGVTRGKNGTGGPLTAGRIAFQSEGAEVFYRNIRITPADGRTLPSSPRYRVPYPVAAPPQVATAPLLP